MCELAGIGYQHKARSIFIESAGREQPTAHKLFGDKVTNGSFAFSVACRNNALRLIEHYVYVFFYCENFTAYFNLVRIGISLFGAAFDGPAVKCNIAVRNQTCHVFSAEFTAACYKLIYPLFFHPFLLIYSPVLSGFAKPCIKPLSSVEHTSPPITLPSYTKIFAWIKPVFS